MAELNLSRAERRVVFGYVNEANEAIELRGDSASDLADAIEAIKTLKRAGGQGPIDPGAARVAANVLEQFLTLDASSLPDAEKRSMESAIVKLRAAQTSRATHPPRLPNSKEPRSLGVPASAPGPDIVIRTDLADARFEMSEPRRLVAFDRVKVERVDFSKGRFERFRFSESSFIDCDFTSVRFGSYNCGGDARKPSTFVGCRFDRATMPHFDLATTRFERCSFRGTKISGWRSECAEFIDCVFAARIRDTIFYGKPDRCYERIDRANASLDKDGLLFWKTRDALSEFRREAPRRTVNEFHGNDFSEADFDFVDLRDGIVVSAQRWPEDKGYTRLDRWPERLQWARQELGRLPDTRKRANALAMLDILSSRESIATEKILTPAWATTSLGGGGAWELLLGLLSAASTARDIPER